MSFCPPWRIKFLLIQNYGFKIENVVSNKANLFMNNPFAIERYSTINTTSFFFMNQSLIMKKISLLKMFISNILSITIYFLKLWVWKQRRHIIFYKYYMSSLYLFFN